MNLWSKTTNMTLRQIQINTIIALEKSHILLEFFRKKDFGFFTLEGAL